MGGMGFDTLSENGFIPKIEIIPSGYIKDETGITKIVVKKAKDGTETTSLVPLCLMPLSVHSKLCNPDTGDVYYVIEFENRKVQVAGTDLAQKKGIMQLAGQGLLATENHAADLSEYIFKTIKLCVLPEFKIYDRMGWKDNGFVLGQTFISATESVPITLAGVGKQAHSIKSCGDMAGWIKAISGLMKHDIQRFKMYNAIVAPLLQCLNESNYSINDYGETSTGKTVTTLLAMSVYGDPYGLLLSGNTTQVGIERAATQFCDLPINLDDIQNIKKEVLDGIIYMMANGVGKVRGAKNGGLQEVLTWRTVGLFTGETPIITGSSFMGMEARLIELYGGLKESDKEAVGLFEVEIPKHHGVFAPILIKYIIENCDEIKKLHQKSIEMIKGKIESYFGADKTKSGIANRLSNTFATILTAGKVFEELYDLKGGKYQDPETIVLEIFKEVIGGKTDESYAMRGLNHILSWISSNRSNFLIADTRATSGTESSVHEQRYKIYGNISELYYDILPSELRAELTLKEFSPDRLFKEFAMMGIFESDKGKFVKTVRLEDSPVKVYRLKRKVIEGLDIAFSEVMV